MREEGELTTAAETQGQQQEQDQPAPFPTLSPDQGPAKEEVDELLWLFRHTHSELGGRSRVYKMGVYSEDHLPRVLHAAEGNTVLTGIV
jgi:hypothetical protein